ncbi:MAG: Gfo/Idh/MocA family oxidoreductase [Elusimicrobia bacterium]|nr:Gfo/Idh/MocA family oxidoreductase [Elusimicrobiota bacterium]MBI2916349.1 Gfo/Idh/MocA family oxidoreductase [Elusimicrobiota bacterium]
MEKVRIGVIGCGYWGPNLVRNFSSLNRSQVVYVADKSRERLQHVQSLYPHIQTTQDASELIRSQEVDAVCIATPLSSHYALAKESLLAGKNLLVEKPFVLSGREGQDLVEIAKSKKKVLMVDHTFLFSPPVRKMKEMITQNVLGKIHYLYSVRVNLGLFQKDINVVWDLAAHDISIVNYLLGVNPESVSVIGRKLAVQHVEDVAFVFVNYPGNILFQLHLSWLDPHKIRKITLIGDKKMVVYDDLDANEPLKFYDKGVSVQPYYDTFGEFKMLYRYGDVISPRIEPAEPLRNLCEHFLDCIEKGTTPLSDGMVGLEVVRALEAAQKSVDSSGKLVSIQR